MNTKNVPGLNVFQQIYDERKESLETEYGTHREKDFFQNVKPRNVIPVYSFNDLTTMNLLGWMSFLHAENVEKNLLLYLSCSEIQEFKFSSITLDPIIEQELFKRVQQFANQQNLSLNDLKFFTVNKFCIAGFLLKYKHGDLCFWSTKKYKPEYYTEPFDSFLNFLKLKNQTFIEL